MPDPLTYSQLRRSEGAIRSIRQLGDPALAYRHEIVTVLHPAALEFIRQALPHLRSYRRELVTKAHDAGFHSPEGRALLTGWVARLDRLLETYP